MGSGKTKVNHTQKGSGKFALAAAAVERFVRTKKTANCWNSTVISEQWDRTSPLCERWRDQRQMGWLGMPSKGWELGLLLPSSCPIFCPHIPFHCMETLSWRTNEAGNREHDTSKIQGKDLGLDIQIFVPDPFSLTETSSSVCYPARTETCVYS